MIDLKLSIPEGWLEEEERSGFLVTKERKELWAVEMDLLEELRRVCQKHNIQYFAAYGTLLGAVRHHGFIPWDDDIDLLMTRDQYDRLCEAASSEFKDPYFFQTEYTDFGSFRTHAQLRNCRTTAILETEKGMFSFNQGIFIDIFPMDAVCEDETLFQKQIEEMKELRKKFYELRRVPLPATKEPKLIRNLYKKILKARYYTDEGKCPKADEYYRRYEEVSARYNDQNTTMIADLSFTLDDRKYFKRREDYQSTTEMPFEFITIPANNGYDRVLRDVYGDYMKPAQADNDHGGLIMDTDVPYTEYLKKF